MLASAHTLPLRALLRGVRLRACRRLLSSTSGAASAARSIVPEAPWYLRRPVRVFRVAVLGFTLYQTGKAAGHTEALQDPDGMVKTLVKAILESQHVSSRGAKPEAHGADSPLQVHVKAVGERVLAATRAWVAHETARLEAELEAAKARGEYLGDLRDHLRDLRAGAERIAGEWTWLVTNSEGVNAFVSPYCPRHVFVHEGLLHALTPTEDELAFLIAHELSHVVFAHGERQLEHTAIAATAQLVVLSLIDPTGVLEFVLTATFGQWLEAAYVKEYSRVSEAQADDCGIGILHAGCFDIRAASSMMAKVGEASGHTRASWTDTHPPPLERVEHLQRRAVALAEEGTHQDCRSVVQLLKRLYRASTRSKREFA
mmetsp:Transcript_36305/g.116969  ORF Transcript_36305/g.116969 Transcript_36305/m.116969 type:complete len:372 (-) Transcript_36305:116-1231(-)